MKLPLVVSTKFFMLATSIFLVATFALHDYMHAIRRLHASTRFITCMYGKNSVHPIFLFSTLFSFIQYTEFFQSLYWNYSSLQSVWKSQGSGNFIRALWLKKSLCLIFLSEPFNLGEGSMMQNRMSHFVWSHLPFSAIAGAIFSNRRCDSSRYMDYAFHTFIMMRVYGLLYNPKWCKCTILHIAIRFYCENYIHPAPFLEYICRSVANAL